jgi:4-hydroxy-4-methyl-2-oxoglutarate aldolase
MTDTDAALAPELLERAARLGSATVHEAARRIGALPATIRPVDPSWRIAGPARTVVTPSGDNLAIHHAIYATEPGEILVVSTGDEAPSWGYWGEIMSHAARARRIAGLVLQGGSRDHAMLPSVGFPVFSLGACIRGTIKDPTNRTATNTGPTIRIGDIDIAPGDLIIGDVDGVVAIPAHRAAEFIDLGIKREEHEADVIARLRAGETTLDIYDLP